MGPLDSLLTDRVSLIKQDGRRFDDMPASVQSGKIFTDDSKIPVEDGDHFERRTPSGVTERFLIIDAGFMQAIPGMSAHYQSKVRKEAAGGVSKLTVAGGSRPNGDAAQAVFIVHGHDDAVRESVARYIERLGLRPIILHEQASQGRTIIEKLEYHADVKFAVVLLTPDDVGAAQGESNLLKQRARQNVVLELGFFVGKLGRQRVCAIHKGQVELPSDYVGVVYLPFDDSGGWRLILARELKAAGFAVDLNVAV